MIFALHGFLSTKTNKCGLSRALRMYDDDDLYKLVPNIFSLFIMRIVSKILRIMLNFVIRQFEYIEYIDKSWKCKYKFTIFLLIISKKYQLSDFP